MARRDGASVRLITRLGLQILLQLGWLPGSALVDQFAETQIDGAADPNEKTIKLKNTKTADARFGLKYALLLQVNSHE